MNRYRPILNVYVIWYPDKLFGRGIGIPTCFRCVAESGKKVPLTIDFQAVVHTVMIILLEDQLVLIGAKN